MEKVIRCKDCKRIADINHKYCPYCGSSNIEKGMVFEPISDLGA